MSQTTFKIKLILSFSSFSKPDVSDPMLKVTLTKFRSLSFYYCTRILLSYNRDWTFNTTFTRYLFLLLSLIPLFLFHFLQCHSTSKFIPCSLLCWQWHANMFSLNSPIQLSSRAAFYRTKQTHSSAFSYSISCVLMAVHNRFCCSSTIPMQGFGKLHPSSPSFTRKTLSTSF